MKQIIFQIQPSGQWRPFSEDDRIEAAEYKPYQMVRAKTYGARKERAYRELCAYWGSCRYVADQAFNENMNSKIKVDCFTRIKLGFVKGTFVDHAGNVQWIPDDLNYDNCSQPKAHEFIRKALEEHASLVGMDSADEYVAHLRQLGQGYA